MRRGLIGRSSNVGVSGGVPGGLAILDTDETGEFRRDVAIGTMPAPRIFGLEVYEGNLRGVNNEYFLPVRVYISLEHLISVIKAAGIKLAKGRA